MGNFAFWQRWLVVLGLLITTFGIGITLLNGTALFDTLFNRQIDPVFWDEAEPDDRVRDFQQWVYGVLGATMAGWGVLITAVAYYPFRHRERWAWYSLAVAVGLWFVLDSYVSLSAGNMFNEFVINVPLLILALVPLWFTRK